MKVAVVDTGGANIASVLDALERLGVPGELTADPKAISAGGKVILPGVGSAADAMERLDARGLASCLKTLRQPVLGICLGMQLLFERSDEGEADCLGVLPGTVVRVLCDGPIPHMGWNEVRWEAPSRLLKRIPQGAFFYFVHSYRAPWGEWVKAFCEYGENIPAVVEKENYFGVQFHPERSGESGAALLANFLAL